MQAVLPILIDRAQAERDRTAVASRQCAQALAQAHATLGQLERFREDYLRRSPVLAGHSFQAERLGEWQLFVSRLDHAIGLQRHEIQIREHQQAHAQAQLGHAQRRLLSFDTLARAAARQHQLRQDRYAQKESDEFAARAGRAQWLGESP
jgi:flagellar protein FliJ